jgi:hypothetical protein
MPILTEMMKRAVAELNLCYVATVTPEGRPNLSPKGSLEVWDDDHLIFADMASPVTVANLERNPFIEINIVDPFSRRGYRFKGQATVLREGEVFETVRRRLRERHGPRLPVNGVVKVRVEAAAPVVSPAYMVDPTATEADIRRQWMTRYGVQPAASATDNGR